MTSTGPGADLAPHLASWAEELERGRWSGWIVDGHLVLRYLSSEHRGLLERSSGRSLTDDEIGIGLNIFEALTLSAWQVSVDPTQFAAIFPRQFGSWKFERKHDGVEPTDYIPEPFVPLLEAAEEVETFGLIADHFEYLVPEQPPTPAEFLLVRLRAHTGELQGAVLVNQVGMPPTLQTLLARGDRQMYERMAELSEPRRCQAAILFADLQGSVALSKSLPTATFFSFVRDMATVMDSSIASHGGIVGKHAGDGVSGFFLLEDGTTPSAVVRGAIEAGRAIREGTSEVLRNVATSNGIDPAPHGMNIGIHWGGSIYMGQLVPGGRLDITALGDSINETARIQECATNGAILASKPLLEHLTDEDASALGVEPFGFKYEALADLETASDKAKRDAVAIPVTRIV